MYVILATWKVRAEMEMERDPPGHVSLLITRMRWMAQFAQLGYNISAHQAKNLDFPYYPTYRHDTKVCSLGCLSTEADTERTDESNATADHGIIVTRTETIQQSSRAT